MVFGSCRSMDDFRRKCEKRCVARVEITPTIWKIVEWYYGEKTKQTKQPQKIAEKNFSYEISFAPIEKGFFGLLRPRYSERFEAPRDASTNDAEAALVREAGTFVEYFKRLGMEAVLKEKVVRLIPTFPQPRYL